MRPMRVGFISAVVGSHAGIVAVAMWGASWLRFGTPSNALWSDIFASPLAALIVYVVLALLIFRAMGIYRFDERWTLRSEIFASAKAVGLLAVVTFSLLYLLKLSAISRLFLISFLVICWAGITLASVSVRAFYSARRQRGTGCRQVLLVGTNPAVLPFIDRLVARHSTLGIRVVGYLGSESGLVKGITYLGRTDRLPQIMREMIVDEVLVAPDDMHELDDVIRTARVQGKTARIPLPSMGYSLSHGVIEIVDDTPVLAVYATSNKYLWLGIKRVTDVAGAMLGLILLSPIFLATALAIRIADGPPVIFRQKRVGMNGRIFDLVKFRTMVLQAESLKGGILDLNERQGPVFKVRNDPRTTRLGRMLRRTSMDELPQLWNVLRGNMSLVGPRPPLVDEVNHYDNWHLRRLSMRPGITGLWQVKYRNEPDFDRWVEVDLEYIDNWSPALDSRILALTIPAVFKAQGS